MSAGPVSAMIYTGGSLLAGAAFFLVTLLTGDYSWFARIGGGIWVFLLCMIILMPTVTPWMRRRLERRAATAK
jgi:hypothetical protein